jgi:hypothetical protein
LEDVDELLGNVLGRVALLVLVLDVRLDDLLDVADD